MLHRLLRAPLLHFALLGVVLYALQPFAARMMAPWSDAHRITVSLADIERLRDEWRRDSGRPPTTVQLEASLARFVDEEIMLREAFAVGLDRTDPVARARLVRNLRFAFPDATADDASLLRQAQALGMAERDLVVRRRLVQRMEQRLAGSASVTDADIVAYVAAHPERYGRPARIAFMQVYLGEQPAAADVASMRAGLQSGAIGPEAAAAPFLPGWAGVPATRAEIQKTFGAAFAQAIDGIAADAWSGPLRSVHGLHLVRVIERRAALPAALDEVRSQAAFALSAEQQPARLRAALEQLRARYRVGREGLQLAQGPVP